MARATSLSAPGAAEEAAAILAGGGVIVIPSDTVYGIAASLGNAGAVKRIFEIKRRPPEKPLPVLVGDLEEAKTLGRFSPEAERAAVNGWPGALTLVVPAEKPLRQLGGDGSSVGIRVPNHPFVLDVLRRCGPLAATSANLSGEPEARTVSGLAESLAGQVDLIIDGGSLLASPSRVVSFVGSRRVLRQ